MKFLGSFFSITNWEAAKCMTFVFRSNLFWRANDRECNTYQICLIYWALNIKESTTYCTCLMNPALNITPFPALMMIKITLSLF